VGGAKGVPGLVGVLLAVNVNVRVGVFVDVFDGVYVCVGVNEGYTARPPGIAFSPEAVCPNATTLPFNREAYTVDDPADNSLMSVYEARAN